MMICSAGDSRRAPRQLDLSSEFYNGEKKSCEEVISLVRKAHMINAVGKKSVGCCLKAKLIESKETPKIEGIPYLQLVFI